MYLLIWVGSGACNSKGLTGIVYQTFGSRIFIVSLEAMFSVQLAESVTLEHVTHIVEELLHATDPSQYSLEDQFTSYVRKSFVNRVCWCIFEIFGILLLDQQRR